MIKIEIDHSKDKLLRRVRDACVIAQGRLLFEKDPRICKAMRKAASHLDAALFQFEKAELCRTREKLLR